MPPFEKKLSSLFFGLSCSVFATMPYSVAAENPSKEVSAHVTSAPSERLRDEKRETKDNKVTTTELRGAKISPPSQQMQPATKVVRPPYANPPP